MTIRVSRHLPTHLDLPDTDGVPMNNLRQLAQIRLMSSVLRTTLAALHPDNDYCVGEDLGIYFHLTSPPLNGCRAPDWFYVPGVPPLLNGELRRSYVLWQERVAPLLAIEFPSGDGGEERDRTAMTGRFWIYEQAIRATYYIIYEYDPTTMEAYRLKDGTYHRLKPNRAKRYPIPELGVELGGWLGTLDSYETHWLRAYDKSGLLLPTAEEVVEIERGRADAATSRADALAAKLRELGIDPDSIGRP